jgi:hypothetical protein
MRRHRETRAPQLEVLRIITSPDNKDKNNNSQTKLTM